MLTTGGHYAYLKIAEGCDKHCTYCIIPKLRGNYRSVPMEQLLKEARRAGRGRREGADSGSTGDYPLRKRHLWRKKLPSSVAEEAVPGSAVSSWIRVLYCYPEEIYRRADPGYEGRAEDLSLSGSSDSACI